MIEISEEVRQRMRVAPWVICAGGIGGVLSWVFSITIGRPAVLESPWQAIPAFAALGMGAAFIGVYVIAHSDTRALMRCLGFALLCGVSWKPIFDAGDALVEQSIGRRADADVTRLTAQLEQYNQILLLASEDELPEQIRHAANITAELLTTLPKSNDPHLRKLAEVRIKQTVAALRKTIDHADPKEIAEVLAEVGMAGAVSGSPEVAHAAARSLGSVVRTTTDRSIALFALEKLGSISAIVSRESSPWLAFSLDEARAEAILAMAGNAIENGDDNLLRRISLIEVRQDSMNAATFHKLVGDLNELQPSIAWSLSVDERMMRAAPGYAARDDG